MSRLKQEYVKINMIRLPKNYVTNINYLKWSDTRKIYNFETYNNKVFKYL